MVGRYTPSTNQKKNLLVSSSPASTGPDRSNSVNVFLGIGLPWSIAAIYWSVLHPQSGRGEERVGVPLMSRNYCNE